ncbi:hypothetical protein ACFC58_24895 [Kitasatospora purpeofusca]|uniref:hypothetical protein n=1 Tax=Kitasatospora purpeofusca TaxID=67352 RepID=UPI0035D5F5C4
MGDQVAEAGRDPRADQARGQYVEPGGHFEQKSDPVAGQVSIAVRDLNRFARTGWQVCAERAERRLFALVLLLGQVVPEGGGPSAAGPPAPLDRPAVRLRRPGLQLTTQSMRTMNSDDRFV